MRVVTATALRLGVFWGHILVLSIYDWGTGDRSKPHEHEDSGVREFLSKIACGDQDELGWKYLKQYSAIISGMDRCE